MKNKIKYEIMIDSFEQDYVSLMGSNISEDIAQSMIDKYENKDNDLKDNYEKLENVNQNNDDDILNKYDTCECVNIIDKLNKYLKYLQVEQRDSMVEQAKILHEYYKMYTEIQIFINEMSDARYGNIVCGKCLKIYNLEYECEHMSVYDNDYGENDIDNVIEIYDQYCNECNGEPLCSHCWYASSPSGILS